MITAQFSGNKIYSSSNVAFSLYEKSRFGEKKQNKIEYSIVEALFLDLQGKMQIFSGKKQLDSDSLIKKAKRLDKRIEIKLPVFTDLRKRGYIIKTALKFGADFRVYKKGVKPGQDHALWLLYPVKESESHSWYDFAAKNRVAHSARKNLLIGVLDDEDDVSYYEVSWLKP
ncbi:MAG: tRNA-intron lyase [Nanoarchaeota archaeon]|nr:tRNA-intron lyase [Nanoarchaeota archaeon]